jgi:glyoxylase-like metal-dependent hydrolase (beta-lactamase superfamily II)
MKDFAERMSYVDLEFERRPRVIATAVLHGPAGAALIDPGPTSTMGTLQKGLQGLGLSLDRVSAILLTHIHLDHAGSCGDLVAEFPHLRVYVHERGAPHLIDPSKLLASASRLYGEENMDRLWGTVRPIPEGAVEILRGGESIDAAGQLLEVEYTPGHASHHVSYFSRSTRVAFVGDTAGIKPDQRGRIVPPTPPPDIDLEAWESSLELIERRQPATLFLTHFGPHGNPREHLAELRSELARFAALVRESLEWEGTDEDRESRFADQVRMDLVSHTGGVAMTTYESAARLDLNWRGLARYWRKRVPA